MKLIKSAHPNENYLQINSTASMDQVHKNEVFYAQIFMYT